MYGRIVRLCMLAGSEAWLVKRKKTALPLCEAEMRIVGWMSYVKLTERFLSTELRGSDWKRQSVACSNVMC